MSSLSALVLSYIWLDLAFLTPTLFYVSLVLLAYFAYYAFCRRYFYAYIPKASGLVHRGRTPPPFPNGWFVIARMDELKPLTVKPIAQSGHNMVLFCGEDGSPYVLDAYCPHSGAHLGVGGQVKYKSCIQCPFHGFLFDGKTGNLVSGEGLKQRKMEFYKYSEDLGKCNLKGEEMLKKTSEGTVKIRKFKVLVRNGFLHVWLHADPNAEPPYEPLDFSEDQKRLVYKGVSMNKIFAHCQDIVENGGDIRHFVYVHSYLLPFTRLFGAKWDAHWLRGSDPQLREKMAHKIPWVNAHKQKIFDKYLTKANCDSIGVMYLNMSIQLPFCSPFFFFNATIFQVGPGLVYLFLISPFYEAIFFQHTTTIDKFDHDVYHELYASGYLPHGLTALMLRLEAQQVTNDTYVWNEKVFMSEPIYQTESEADATILSWRRWFGQFYEGCAKAQAEKEKMNW
jgi:cholesterol 7-desaturase